MPLGLSGAPGGEGSRKSPCLVLCPPFYTAPPNNSLVKSNKPGGHCPIFFSSDCAGNFQLLRLGLHVMGNYEPAPVAFLVDVRNNVVHLLISAVLHFWCPALLPHFPREIAVNVNVLV